MAPRWFEVGLGFWIHESKGFTMSAKILEGDVTVQGKRS